MFWLIVLATFIAITSTWCIVQWRRTYPEEHEFRLYERSINEY